MSDFVVVSKLDGIEARRAARKAAEDEAKAEQYAKDLEELDRLEGVHGCAALGQLRVAFVPGLPTMVIVKRPDGEYVKRFTQQAQAANGKPAAGAAATILLGESCVVYPDAATYARMCETFGTLKLNVGNKAFALVNAEAVEAGKD
jgi:hypothetical protein